MAAIRELTSDILAQLATDFPPSELQARCQQLATAFGDDRTRRCLVWAARGHGWYFDFLCRLDYRDVISAAEMAPLGGRLLRFQPSDS